MPGVTTSLDTSVFERKVRTLLGRRHKARDLAVLVQADHVVGYVVKHGPEDTMRFKRAIIMAGNQAGVRTRTLPPLRESKNRHFSIINNEQSVKLAKANVDKATKLLAKWQKLEEFYRRRPSGRRPDSTHYKYFKTILLNKRNAEKELRFHARRLDAAMRELAEITSDEGKTAITIGSFGRGEVFVHSGGINAYAERVIKSKAFKQRKSFVILKRTINVVSKIHGGEGRIERVGDSTFVHIVNKEPHARLVQRKTRIMSKAVGSARKSTGAKRITKRKYLEHVAANTGMGKGAA